VKYVIADYLIPARCYKCSRYNHKHYDCRGEETCPHCAGKHKKNVQAQKVNTNASTVSPIVDSTRKER